MTLPAWALKIGTAAASAAAEIAHAHPENHVDLARVIAAEVARFHAAQEPGQLLAAVTAVADLCAETEDGRLVTKDAVSPGDFLLRIKAVLTAAAADITWRVAFIERLAALEDAVATQRRMLARVWPIVDELERLRSSTEGSNATHPLSALHADLMACLAHGVATTSRSEAHPR